MGLPNWKHTGQVDDLSTYLSRYVFACNMCGTMIERRGHKLMCSNSLIVSRQVRHGKLLTTLTCKVWILDIDTCGRYLTSQHGGEWKSQVLFPQRLTQASRSNDTTTRLHRSTSIMRVRLKYIRQLHQNAPIADVAKQQVK